MWRTWKILKPDIPNTVVFGETGGGKSSVINMLDGDGPLMTVEDGHSY
jgi:putative ribosome biogenesis GTPase RsgA